MAVPAETIVERIRRIPEGFVATYGDVCPDAPRYTGRVLKQVSDEVPWWRVVHADGTWVGGERQQALLMEEEVPIRGHRVVMDEARVPPEALL
jgi:methylated-DNA-protein-cysteine methyltransferase-like protein